MGPFSLVNILNQARALPEFLKTAVKRPSIQPVQQYNAPVSSRQTTGGTPIPFFGSRTSPLQRKPEVPTPLPRTVPQRSNIGGEPRTNLPNTFSLLQQLKGAAGTLGKNFKRQNGMKTHPLGTLLPILQVPQRIASLPRSPKEAFSKYREYLNQQGYGYRKQEDVDKVVRILEEQLGPYGNLTLLDLQKVRPEDREFMKKAKQANFNAMLGMMMATTAPASSIHTKEGIIDDLVSWTNNKKPDLLKMSMPELQELYNKSLPEIMKFKAAMQPGGGGRPWYERAMEKALFENDVPAMKDILSKSPPEAVKGWMELESVRNLLSSTF
jgi:hypothetical protein